MDSVTHVAGPMVHIRGRIIQRCPVCGEKLADNRNCAMLINKDGTPPEFPTWGETALVEIEPGNPTRYSVVGNFMDEAPLPENFCLTLVE